MEKRNGKIKLNFENNNLLYNGKYKNEKFNGMGRDFIPKVN